MVALALWTYFALVPRRHARRFSGPSALGPALGTLTAAVCDRLGALETAPRDDTLEPWSRPSPAEPGLWPSPPTEREELVRIVAEIHPPGSPSMLVSTKVR